MEKTNKKLSWKPILRGRIYCAPACGGNCTKKEFDNATEKAQRLACRLGKNWKPVVWENLGWHYKAVDKTESIQVYAHCYTKEISYSANVGGFHWADSKKPEEAIIKSINLFRGMLENYIPLAKATGIKMTIQT